MVEFSFCPIQLHVPKFARLQKRAHWAANVISWICLALFQNPFEQAPEMRVPIQHSVVREKSLIRKGLMRVHQVTLREQREDNIVCTPLV